MKPLPDFNLASIGAAWVVMLFVAAPHLLAAETNRTGEAEKAQVRPSYPVPYLLYRHPGACLPYGACGGLWWWEDRRKPKRPVAPEQPSFTEQDIWGPTGSPWGYVRRLPPPTPESHIQPRYRDASTIRPEFNEPTDSAPR
jgi:hypothetical protein